MQVTFGASKRVVPVFATALLLKVLDSEFRGDLLSAVLCLQVSPRRSDTREMIDPMQLTNFELSKEPKF